MKSCSTCHGTYPDSYMLCPQDGTALKKADPWAEGAVIRGKYRILSKIGQGGMGAVYKALHLPFQELRALKVMSPDLLNDQAFVKRFEHEAILARKLQHPNAVRVEDIDTTEEGQPFIVMEYIEGRSLKSSIETESPMPASRVCPIIKQVASALDAAHRLGIVHRDVKPENIILVQGPDGELAKVLDFGVAKMNERVSETAGWNLTQTGTLLGTPSYMSPEQALGKRGDELDGRSDIYSLGVVMYQMLTGELPLKAETPFEILTALVHTPPKPIGEVRPDLHLHIPEPLANLAMRTLEKDRELRPPTARALIQELEHAEEEVRELAGMARPPATPARLTKGPEEKAEQDRRAWEQAEQERRKQERAEAERLEAGRVEAERLARERTEQERLAQEQAEHERQERERAEAERRKAEQAESKRLARERAEQERLAQEQAEHERQERERVEAERRKAKRAEAKRLARERAEQERLAQEQAEHERQEQERAEAERRKAERAEAKRLARERAEQERRAGEGTESVWRHTGVTILVAILAVASGIGLWWYFHSKGRQTEVADILRTGETYLDRREYGKAIAEFQHGLEVYPTNQELKGKLDQARKDANQVDVQKKISDALKAGEEYLQQGKYEEAIREFQNGLELDPTNEELKSKLDQAQETGKQADVQNRISEALMKGKAYLDRREYEKAIAEFQIGLELDPTNQELKGRLDQAQAAKEAAVRKATTDALKSGQAYMDRGEYDGAIREFQNALKLDPTNRELKRRIDQAQRAKAEEEKLKIKP
jgi:eukaryotic-like serine/threonine-protein kinase